MAIPRRGFGFNNPEILRNYGVVRGDWEIVGLSGDKKGKKVITLKDDGTFDPERGVRPGDVFSAILMSGSQNYQGVKIDRRIFGLAKYKIMGYAKQLDPGLYKTDLLLPKELRHCHVYRFNVFHTEKDGKGQRFYCRAFKHLVGDEARSLDYVKEEGVDLPRREPFEYVSGQKYVVGVDHMASDWDPPAGIFYDALHPGKMGHVRFGPEYLDNPEVMDSLRYGGWVVAQVTGTEMFRRGPTVLSYFVGFPADRETIQAGIF